jgi:hypothetical protein
MKSRNYKTTLPFSYIVGVNFSNSEEGITFKQGKDVFGASDMEGI